MKLYDFDGMFDEKLSAYMQKNKGKYTQDEWEDIIPQMYAKFGDTVVKSIGKTPNEYYGSLSDEELIKSFSGHIKQGLPVNSFLNNAIESRKNDALLIPLLDGTDEEILYAVNLLGASSLVIPKYFNIVTTSQNDDVCNACLEYLKERADDVKTEAVSEYKAGVKREYMLEILSHCVTHDDQALNVLLTAFRTEDENLAVHAGYLASFGDERALPVLLDRIEDENISFADFRELKFAIESLGGSYDKERDFSSDPYYEIIKSHGVADVDIFKDIK